MAVKGGDKQANFAAIQAIESAAATLTFAKFAFPFSIQDKMALIISRIEYWFGGIHLLDANTENIVAGLSAAGALVDPFNQADPLIIDSMRMYRDATAVPQSTNLVQLPWVKDFSTLVGGGLMVAPAPLYAFVKATGGATPTSCWLKLFYTYKSLSTDEYWELVETRRVISS